MAFDVSGTAYGRFMGRYSEPLSAVFADAAGVSAGQRVLDVGCGPGALTAELVERVGAERVCAVDPSEPFVAAARARLPAVDVRTAPAEALPFGAGAFDATLAQLVVHFMADPVQGLREMARVTAPGGVVAACVWDLAGERAPLSTFWAAVRDLDPTSTDESGLAGVRAGHLAELFRGAGLTDLAESELTVAVRYADVHEWWEPYTLGVGPAGDHVAGLDEPSRERLRARCAELLPAPPFDVRATAWCVVAAVG